MSMRIGIVGAGLAGRLLALECLQRGFSITLFDQDTMAGKKSCGWTAAGMVAPYTELESCEPLVFKLGIETLQIWPTILQQLTQPVSAKFLGTLVVAHPQDVAELARFRMIIQHKLQRHSDINSKVLTTLSREKLESFEPGLSPKIREGYWMPEEGSIDNVEFFYATTAFLQTHPQVTWLEKTKVTALQPHCIQVNDQEYIFDLVCDTRGLGAKSDWPGLRGIRGELIWVHAPQVTIACPIRLLHPRYPIYISPRANHHYVIGATAIESDDQSPISVESTLELLSAAYAVHTGFAEARIINMLTHARPTFTDQQPKINYVDGLLKINGLYRHGYLVGPAVIQEALRLIENGSHSINKFPDLFCEDIEYASHS